MMRLVLVLLLAVVAHATTMPASSVHWEDSSVWPESDVPCDGVSINRLPSVDYVSCTLVAQARKGFASIGTDSSHGACLDYDAKKSTARHTFQAGFGPCLDDAKQVRSSTEFLYHPTTQKLYPGDAISSKRFVRLCKMHDNIDTTPLMRTAFGYDACDVASYNRKDECTVACPSNGAVIDSESNETDSKFIFVKMGNSSNFRIQSVSTGQCIDYLRPNMEQYNDVQLNVCYDDRKLVPTTWSLRANSFRMHARPNKKCLVKCATGYTRDASLVGDTGLTNVDMKAFLQCPANATLWTYLKDPCPFCAPGYHRVGNLCKLYRPKSTTPLVTVFQDGKCGVKHTEMAVNNAQCYPLPSINGVNASARVTCHYGLATSPWTAEVFMGTTCGGWKLGVVNGVNASSCEAPVTQASSKLTLSVNCADHVKLDCQYSAFSNWTGCSATCGDGWQYRHRTVLQHGAYGGVMCNSSSLREVQACKVTGCPTDCKVGAWGNWTTCTKTCGSGTQTRVRPVVQAAAFGGVACPELTQSQACSTDPCKVDCQVGNWSSWESCSVTCGGGTKLRTRPVVQAPMHGGHACPALNESVVCGTAECPTDCQMSPWSVWGSCSQPCGQGNKYRNRTVLITAKNGGAPCKSTYERLPCESQDCPASCATSAWSQWGNCSATCGTGYHSRTRTPLSNTTFTSACGTLKETEPCNTVPCQTDCQVSAWSVWSPCSASCGGGVSTRNRTVVVASANNGAACPALVQTMQCGATPCPVACQASAWSDFSNCSASCGGGVKTRTRKVLTPALYGGATCGMLEDTQTCNEQACPVYCHYSQFSSWTSCSQSCGKGVKTRRKVLLKGEAGHVCNNSVVEEAPCREMPCPVNCKVTGWSAWSTCTKSCGGGVSSRFRGVLTPNSHGGTQCPHLNETQECYTRPCAQNCVVSNWSSWSSCSAPCGSGFMHRSRKVLSAAQQGGVPCPSVYESVACNTASCPANCSTGVAAWSAWSQCSQSCDGGLTVRTRNITDITKWGGVALCGPVKEVKSCNAAPCKRDCALSNWTSWGTCSSTCGGGLMKRTRVILAPGANGGAHCGDTVEYERCNTNACPVSCSMSPWGTWSQCSKSCNGGYRYRNRTVVEPAQGGGVGCPRSSQVELCNNHSCPVLDCKAGEWGPWSTCSAQCGGGTQEATRPIIAPAENGGAVCVTKMSKVCNTQPCPVNCAVSNWSDWGDCKLDGVCGIGVNTRTRTIVTPSSNGGDACPVLAQSKSCIKSCDALCVYGEWGNWSSCSVSCGGGSKFRARPVTSAPAGHVCSLVRENATCGMSDCQVAKPCQVSAWSVWSNCSATCGAGVQTRSRTVEAVPVYGGAACPALSEERACQQAFCKQDCVLSAWGPWTQCTKSCGGGSSIRNRTVITPSAHGGAVCGELSQSKECNLAACAEHCEVTQWSPWSSCSKSCGGGVSYQNRSVVKQPSANGRPCPVLSQWKNCNVEDCPTPCLLSSWAPWGACSKTCGAGIKYRFRSVLQAPKNNGTACGSLNESMPCNRGSCTIPRPPAWANVGIRLLGTSYKASALVNGTAARQAFDGALVKDVAAALSAKVTRFSVLDLSDDSQGLQVEMRIWSPATTTSGARTADSLETQLGVMIKGKSTVLYAGVITRHLDPSFFKPCNCTDVPRIPFPVYHAPQNLTNLPGPPGPRGPVGPVGPRGPAGMNLDPEKVRQYEHRLARLHKKVDRLIGTDHLISSMEKAIFPLWGVAVNACPDGWTRVNFDLVEQRVHCKPPPAGMPNAPGNSKCNSLAKFPEMYDRCGWTRHCQVYWTKHGCWGHKPTAAPVATSAPTAVVAATSTPVHTATPTKHSSGGFGGLFKKMVPKSDMGGAVARDFASASDELDDSTSLATLEKESQDLTANTEFAEEAAQKWTPGAGFDMPIIPSAPAAPESFRAPSGF